MAELTKKKESVWSHMEHGCSPAASRKSEHAELSEGHLSGERRNRQDILGTK